VDTELSNLSEVTGWRHELHQHPELAFEEHKTSRFVAEKLSSFGLEVTTGIAKTGVVGTLRATTDSERAIALRADMDALPIQEQNSFAHRSSTSGAMHACGHDGHTAMLLGAAQALAQRLERPGNVHFIFQPAEESAGGGAEMVKAGLFEDFPAEAVFGMHNWPGLPVGEFAIRPGPMMAASDVFEIAIRGRGCHGAMPDHGIDPIVVGAELVGALQSIVSRRLAPQEPAVLSVTQFHAGDAWAVIPEVAQLRGTVRSFSHSTSQRVEQLIGELSERLASAHGATRELSYRRGYPPTINSPREAEFCRDTAATLVGAERVHTDLPPSMGAEDFAFMLQERPGAYIWLGNGPTQGSCLLHNPNYDFNDDAARFGIAYWLRLVDRWFAT